MPAKNAVAKAWNVTPSSDGKRWSAWPAGDKYGGGGSASFSWGAVSGAASYDVGWSTAPLSSGDRNDPTLYPNRSNVGSSTSYTNTQGVTIYAAVRSVSSNGEIGPWSSEATLSA